jgi:opacity protein-like surface antigen
MKKLSLILSLCLLATSAAYANPCVPVYDTSCMECEQCPSDAGRFYVGGFGGANWLNFKRHDGIKLKNSIGYVAGGSLGYKFCNGFRVEGEVAYRRNPLKRQNVSTYGETASISGNSSLWTYMGNVIYDFDNVSPYFVPYLGAGVGYAQSQGHVKASNSFESAKVKVKDSGIAGQAIAGVSYRLTSSTSVGVEYRYLLARQHAHEQSVGISLRQSF